MARFKLSATPLDGLYSVGRQPIGDERGFLARLFCADELAEAGWTKPIAQINHTLTRRRGTVRGLHYQYQPHAEMKLVTCLRGAVWDVAVDLRKGSSSLLQWYAAELSAENGRALLIPEGFAHGFQALTDDCELLYCHTSPYVSDAEGVISACDPSIAVPWPDPVIALSNRDQGASKLPDTFCGIEL